MLARMQNAKGFSLVELLVTVGIISIILAIAIPYYMSYRRTSCDKAAAGDLVQLAAAAQRLDSDREEVGSADMGLTQTQLEYVVGPYYGWGGSTRKCDVRIRLDATGEEAEACSMAGSHPAGPNTRYLFRLNISGGSDLPVLHASDCGSGRTYGGPTDMCYTESMYDSSGGNRTPEGVRCSTLTGGM